MTHATLLLLASLAPSNAELLWPLADRLHDRTYISNYIDMNAGSQFQDYRCGRTHGYDGHLGIDVAALDFRVADQGVPVVAVAEGIVDTTSFDTFDRNLWPPYQGNGNGLWVAHEGGEHSLYWHLRRHSVAAEPGETVDRGQFLGYVASSGSSPIPHLHFQWNRSRQLTDNMPVFAGPCSTGFDQFERTPDYVGDAPLRVLALGVRLDSFPVGVFQGGALPDIKQGLLEPVVADVSSGSLPIFAMIQGNFGDRLTLEARDQSGELVASDITVLTGKRRYGWVLQTLIIPASTTAGHWRLNALDADGTQLASKIIETGLETVLPPRFFPRAGISLRVGSTYRVPLTQTVRRAPAPLLLVGAPAGVRIEADELIVPADVNVASRNHWFAVVAQDADGYADVYEVHLVDPDKPVREPQSATDRQVFVAPDGRSLTLWRHPDGGVGALMLNMPAPGTAMPTDWTYLEGNIIGRFARLTAADSGAVVNLTLADCDTLNVTVDAGSGRRAYAVMARHALNPDCRF